MQSKHPEVLIGTITVKFYFGVIRKCRKGWKIGPLFADTPVIAENLFNSLCANIEKNSLVYPDVPECNLPAKELAVRPGMGKVFSTARMYTGKPDIIPVEKVIGVTTFELG